LQLFVFNGLHGMLCILQTVQEWLTGKLSCCQ